MYLYGASGHAKVIIEILEASDIPVEGLFDDNPEVTSLLGYEVRQLADLSTMVQEEFIISIGDNKERKKIAKRLHGVFGTAIHPSSVVSHRMEAGEGTVMMAGVVVNTGARIGKHCIINTNASVDHDCVINDFVHVSPNAALAGNVTVKEGAHIGIGACIIQGITIGEWCTIGAGAVIIRDVPSGTTVVGNPGRIIR